MRLARCALLGLLLFSSPGMAAMYPWEEEPASRWTRDFSNSARDDRVPLPTTQLEQEKIGEKSTVHDLFDRWVLNGSVHVGRGKHYAEVTKDCKGEIELDFSLTPTQWQNPARRKRYYRSIYRLMRSEARSTTASWNIVSSTWTRAASHVTTVPWTSCSARTTSTRRGSAIVTTNFLKMKSTAPTRSERLLDSPIATRIVRG